MVELVVEVGQPFRFFADALVCRLRDVVDERDPEPAALFLALPALPAFVFTLFLLVAAAAVAAAAAGVVDVLRVVAAVVVVVVALADVAAELLLLRFLRDAADGGVVRCLGVGIVGMVLSVMTILGPSRVIFLPLPLKFTPSCHRISLLMRRRMLRTCTSLACKRRTLVPPINSSSLSAVEWYGDGNGLSDHDNARDEDDEDDNFVSKGNGDVKNSCCWFWFWWCV